MRSTWGLGFVLSLAAACGGSDTPATTSMDMTMGKTSTPLNYFGSGSPGDVWQFTIDRGLGTFTGKSDGGKPSDPTAAFTVGGTVETTGSTFLKLTVTSFTGAGQGPTMNGVDNVGYALEIPSVALLIKPQGNSPMIAAVYKGDCTALSGAGFGWVRTGFGSKQFNVETEDVYGSVTLNGNSTAPGIENGNGFSITGTQLTGDGTAHPFDGKGTGTCTDGVISFPNGVTGVATQTSGGLMILDQGQGQGGIVVMGHASLTADQFTGRSYSGFVFHNNSNQTDAIKVTFDSTGSGDVKPYTDLVAGTLGASVVTISNVAGQSDGSVKVNVGSSGDGARGFATAVSDPSMAGINHYIMVLVAQDSDGMAPLNIVLIEEPGHT